MRRFKPSYVDDKARSHRLSGYLDYDDSLTEKGRACPEWHYRGGLQGETLRDAEMIAKLGYVVFAEAVSARAVVPKGPCRR